MQGIASPNAATPDSNSSIPVLSKTARELPDKFIQSLNHQQQGGIDYHDQDDVSEDSAMYWLRIEIIKAKILAKLQTKVPVKKVRYLTHSNCRPDRGINNPKIAENENDRSMPC